MKNIFITTIVFSISLLSFGQITDSIDINQVNAHYDVRGQMFRGGSHNPGYEVPKGSGKHSMFSSGLWMAGKDNAENNHVSVSRFNSQGYDFSTGPLKAFGINKGTTDETHTNQFNRFWKITRQEIIQHISHYSDAGYTIPEAILTWPAHGDFANNYAENLAPFIDIDSNGVYEPENGDYPDVKGDMSLYWIINDNYGEHGESNGTPLGMEIHIQAYAYQNDTLTGVDTILNYSTFLNYRVINRSDTVYHDFITSFWSDSDIGYAFDDYIGCNVELNTMFFYNGPSIDGDGNGISYGNNPPAQFIALIDAPLAETNDGIDNDNDGTIDEAAEKNLLNGMMYFNNNSGPNGDPISANDYNNYMHSRWKDGSSLQFGGTGHDTVTIDAKFMFSAVSDPWFNGTNGVDPNYPYAEGWREGIEEDSTWADRRGVMSSGLSVLNLGDELDYTLAFVWARDVSESKSINNAYSSVLQGFGNLAEITEMYNNGELKALEEVDVSVKEIKATNVLEIYPNPVENNFIVKGAEQSSKYQIIDIKGQTVKEGELKESSINSKNLSSGIYLLKIITKSEAKTVKLIKE